MPRTKEIRSGGVWIYESRVGDRSEEWRVFYRIEREFIVIGELLRSKPIVDMPSFAAWKALVSYDGHPEHPQAAELRAGK